MIATLMIGCQKPELNDKIEVTDCFTASMEEVSPQTKTAMNYDKVVTWSSGDLLSIFLGRSTADQFQLYGHSAGSTKGSFKWVAGGGSVDDNTLPCNIAYYPYTENLYVSAEENGSAYNITNVVLPQTQTYSANSFGNGAFPMVAVTRNLSDHNLKFKNVMGAIQFEFIGTQLVKSISIKGHNGELLAGEATVTASRHNLTPSIEMGPEALTEVTLDCGTGVLLSKGVRTKFIIALPPVTFTQGFTVTLRYQNGEEFSISTEAVNEIRRSAICAMPLQSALGDGSPVPYQSLYIVGSYNDWAHENNQFIYDYNGNNELFSGLIDFGENHAANEFKITGGAWGVDEHSIPYELEQEPEAAMTMLVSGGGNNINVYQAKRYYHFTFMRYQETLKANYSFDQLGIVGDFNGWGNDVVMKFNPILQKFYADVEFEENSTFKLRCDGSWDINWGTYNDLLQLYGENIPAPAGKYRVYADLNNPDRMLIEFNENAFGTEEYPGEFDPEPEPEPEPEPSFGWGLVGEFNSWGGSADIMLTFDGTYYVINDISIEGQFKFRKDCNWTVNLGAPGDIEPFEITPDTETVLMQDGKNMTLPAGTYDIYLDDINNQVWCITDGSYPGGESPSPEDSELSE